MITAGSQKAIFYDIRARACIEPELLMGSSRDHLFMQKFSILSCRKIHYVPFYVRCDNDQSRRSRHIIDTLHHVVKT